MPCWFVFIDFLQKSKSFGKQDSDPSRNGWNLSLTFRCSLSLPALLTVHTFPQSLTLLSLLCISHVSSLLLPSLYLSVKPFTIFSLFVFLKIPISVSSSSVISFLSHTTNTNVSWKGSHSSHSFFLSQFITGLHTVSPSSSHTLYILLSLSAS